MCVNTAITFAKICSSKIIDIKKDIYVQNICALYGLYLFVSNNYARIYHIPVRIIVRVPSIHGDYVILPMPASVPRCSDFDKIYVMEI